MNTKNDTHELEILVKDTFANGRTTGTALLSDEEFSHIEKLTSEWDNPWALNDDPIVKAIRDYACELGDSTGINVGEWELEEWRLKNTSMQ